MDENKLRKIEQILYNYKSLKQESGNKKLINKIEECLNKLDEREREFINNFYFKKLSYMTISELMNVSYKTIYDYKIGVLNQFEGIV